MAKDYVKSRKKPAPSHSSSSQNRGCLFAMILTGLFILGLFLLKLQNDRLKLEAQPKATPTTQTQTSATPAPHLDFYTMLPGNNAPSPQPKAATPPAPPPINANQLNQAQTTELSQPLPKMNFPNAPTGLPNSSQPSSVPVTTVPIPTTTTQPATTQSGYIVRLGLFKDFAKADQLKASITLEGFNVQITSLKKNNVTLHRVWIGPFQTLNEAKAQQKSLKDNQINSEIIKESTNPS